MYFCSISRRRAGAALSKKKKPPTARQYRIGFSPIFFIFPYYSLFTADTKMIATRTQPINIPTMAPFCDYNAGILLDVSEHSTIDATEQLQGKKVMAVVEMMASPLCKSVPDLDIDMNLFESALRASQSKSVRFAEYDHVQEITHRNDMPPEYFDAMYLSGEEQAASRQSALDDLVAITTGQLLKDDEEVCIRGLENHTLENSQRFREAVNKLYDIVYDCQTFEDENGVQVPEEFLAQYLIEVSKVCVEEAMERAAQDAQEANR
jgi:hypothetical protein